MNIKSICAKLEPRRVFVAALVTLLVTCANILSGSSGAANEGLTPKGARTQPGEPLGIEHKSVALNSLETKVTIPTSGCSVDSALAPNAPPPLRTVRWATIVDNPVTGRSNILHAPDNEITPVDPPLTITAFGPAMRYRDLGGLLSRVSPADLARADVIAFEGNGGSPAGIDNGWESSVWTFSDGVTTRVVTFNECLGAAGSDPRIITTGSIIGPSGNIFTGDIAYSSFFGMCSPNPNSHVISYILFDLHSISPGIDVNSRSFSIRIENYHTGTLPASDSKANVCGPGLSGGGTPDPDAVGIFSRCSEK